MEEVRVECYSGGRFAERLQRIIAATRTWQVKEVLADWHTPQGLLFRLVLDDGLAYELQYSQAKDRWRLGRKGIS